MLQRRSTGAIRTHDRKFWPRLGFREDFPGGSDLWAENWNIKRSSSIPGNNITTCEGRKGQLTSGTERPEGMWQRQPQAKKLQMKLVRQMGQPIQAYYGSWHLIKSLPTGFKRCQNANDLAYPSTVAAYPALPGLCHMEEQPASFWLPWTCFLTSELLAHGSQTFSGGSESSEIQDKDKVSQNLPPQMKSGFWISTHFEKQCLFSFSFLFLRK